MERTGIKVVVDANLVLALVLPLPYSDQAVTRMLAWKSAGAELLAPLLLEYEMSAVLRRAAVGSVLTAEAAEQALEHILDLHIRCLPPTRELHRAALQWAERLGQTKIYDAHYVAVAEQAQAQLWTADRRLVKAGARARVNWIHWIGEETSSLTLAP